MSKLIGNKKEFAIEYIVETEKPYLMGKLCLWIDNISIGYYNEDVMLNTIRNSLNNLASRVNTLEYKELEDKNINYIFDTMYSGVDNAKYLIILGESFDDFSVFTFKKGKNLTIVWRLHKETFFDYPNHDNQIRYKELPIVYLLSVIDQFVYGKRKL